MSDFFNEIKVQPEKLRHLVRAYEEDGYKDIRTAAGLIMHAGKVVFSGMGTSLFAPECIISDIRKITQAYIVNPTEIIPEPSGVVSENDVLVLLSQSGESIETATLAMEMKGKNVKTIAITNEPESTLAVSCDVLLELHAGPEKSITNKTFTNTMAVLYMLERAVESGDPEALAPMLLRSADDMQTLITDRYDEIGKIAKDLAPADWIHFIGRSGVSMTIANQSALIFMEGAASYARAFTTGAFRHGPIEICSPEHRAVMYYCENDERDVMCGLETQISGYGSRIYVVTNCECEASRQFHFDADDVREFSFNAAVFMELLLIHVADLRGRTAGVFNITHKICTAE